MVTLCGAELLLVVSMRKEGNWLSVRVRGVPYGLRSMSIIPIARVLGFRASAAEQK